LNLRIGPESGIRVAVRLARGLAIPMELPLRLRLPKLIHLPAPLGVNESPVEVFEIICLFV
jgi:hypothetical protein